MKLCRLVLAAALSSAIIVQTASAQEHSDAFYKRVLESFDGSAIEGVSSAELIPGFEGQSYSQSYSLIRQTRFHVLKVDGPEKSFEGKKVFIPSGAQITVLEEKRDPQLGDLIRLGVDSDEMLSAPSDFWVRASELQNVDPFPEAGFDETLDSPPEGAIPGTYSWTLWKAKMTYCYRFVKRYLLQQGKVRSYLPGASAWMAAGALPRHGFRLTGVGPARARVGDVCVYRGGKHGHGHIEVRLSGGWWYGYGLKAKAINSYAPRPLVGCFRK